MGIVRDAVLRQQNALRAYHSSEGGEAATVEANEAINALEAVDEAFTDLLEVAMRLVMEHDSDAGYATDDDDAVCDCEDCIAAKAAIAKAEGRDS